MEVTVTDGSTRLVSVTGTFTYNGERWLVIGGSPVAVIKASPYVECNRVGGGAVQLDGSASRDPGGDGSPLRFAWYNDFGMDTETLLGTEAILNVTLPLGGHTVGLVVTDIAGLTSQASTVITVADTTPPALVCPVVGTVECAAPGGSSVSLAATASDICSPAIVITNTRTAGGADASGFYPLGTTGVIFTATDASGNKATCSSSVVVRDTTPPLLTLTPNPTTLWPPNHRMVPVQAAWQVSDACDPTAGAILVSATSSEPDDASGTGDGNTTGDIQDASIGLPDTTFLLRAERSGDGPGRVYTLTYVARDASGNTASALGIVTVPHDEGTGPEPVMMSLEGDGTPGMAHLYWNAVSEAEMYDVIQGDLTHVNVSNGEISLGPVHVLASGQIAASYWEGPSGAIPTVGSAFFYLVQYREGQSATGWATESSLSPAEPSSCDIGCPGGPVAPSIASMTVHRK